MAHIAIDARIINSSTGTYVERLLHYLQKIDQKNKYTILLRAKDRNFWQPTAKNFTVEIADFDNYSFKEQFAYKKFLDRLSPDLVHFCMPQQPIRYKGKHVSTFHDLTLLKTYNSDKNWLVFHLKQMVGKFVFRSALKSSKYIITISEYSKKDLVRFGKLNPNKVIVTLLATDVSKGGLIEYTNPFKQFIMYVGSQSDYKNIKRLARAHQSLLTKHPDLGLILVGSLNKSAKMNQKYFEKKKYKNILFTGFIENNKRDWLYANTAAYVFPSLMEGFGLPGLEAMGHGAPVASSNATCLPEIYGKAAIYFNPTDTEEMAKVVDAVISNPRLRNELIKRGYKQVSKYSWEDTAKKTHEVYMKALKN